MRNCLIIGLLLFPLCACAQYNPPPDTAQYNTVGSNPPGYDEANAEWGHVSDKCDSDFKKKKIKTHFATNKCKTDAMRKYVGSFFFNQDALHHYITKRLLLAIQLDKKQVTHDEAGVIGDDLWNNLLSAENATRSAMSAQAMASAQAQAQHDTARNIAILNALKQPFDTQRQWVNQQNSSIINCNSSGGMTSCRQGY